MLSLNNKMNHRRHSSDLIQFELTKNSYFNEKIIDDDLTYSDKEDDHNTKENFNSKTIAVCQQLPIKNKKKLVVFKSITFRLGRDRYDIRALREELRK